jgi:ankyrin repeat protein
MWAAEEGHTATVQALLEAGADRTVRSKVADAQTFSLLIMIVLNLLFMVNVAGQ